MITIDLGSSIVTYVILAVLAWVGFTRGFRYMVSIAIFEILGYLLTVQSGNFLVGLINRFYSNLPKLFAFLLGRDSGSVDALGPIIPDNFQSPLLLRVLVFVALLAVGISYAWPWEGKALAGYQGFRSLRLLGALTGLYAGVLGITAAATFWNDAAGALDWPPLLSTALSGLPNFVNIIPSLITAFAILLIIIIMLRFNRVWKP